MSRPCADDDTRAAAATNGTKAFAEAMTLGGTAAAGRRPNAAGEDYASDEVTTVALAAAAGCGVIRGGTAGGHCGPTQIALDADGWTRIRMRVKALCTTSENGPFRTSLPQSTD